jgi:hypothetical protein
MLFRPPSPKLQKIIASTSFTLPYWTPKNYFYVDVFNYRHVRLLAQTSCSTGFDSCPKLSNEYRKEIFWQ